MSIIADHALDDEHAEVIHGRPDFHQSRFGVKKATKYPPYVFGIRGGSCLVHTIRNVDMYWWRVGGNRGECLVKLKRPVMIARTTCSQHFRLDPDIARTCRVPSPDALLCGRCQGAGSTFGKRGPSKKDGITRQEAHVKLGCVVQGY